MKFWGCILQKGTACNIPILGTGGTIKLDGRCSIATWEKFMLKKCRHKRYIYKSMTGWTLYGGNTLSTSIQLAERTFTDSERKVIYYEL